jgi:hypothetical protein
MKRYLFAIVVTLFGCMAWGQVPSGGYGPGQSGGGGSSTAANSPLPAATSGPGPVFNVQNYGAKGDAQSSPQLACTTVGTTAVTCTGTAFSAATDIGKNWFCANGTSSFYPSLTTITAVSSATAITVSQAAAFSAICTGVWGTLADTPVSTAVTAALAASHGVQSSGNKGIFTAAPTLYFPAGGYLLCTTLLNSVVPIAGAVDGFTVLGDGRDSTFLYAGSGATPCPLTSGANFGSFVNVGGSATNILIKSITFDGANNSNGGSVSAALAIAGTANLQDVTVQRWGGAAGPSVFYGGGGYVDRLFVVNGQGTGLLCASCSADFNNIGISNNLANLVFQNVVGSPTSPGVRVRGASIIDECGSVAGCTQLTNSQDIWFEGLAAYGTPNGFCVTIDANSFLHWLGGICGVYLNDTITGGPKIAAGGTLLESDVRNISTGTAKCITNNGVFLDNGGNTCESLFNISSGTSTLTAAVLTVTTNPTTLCTAGDTIEVEGAPLAGYNGLFPFAITAVSATTISYTTVASGIGALGSGGFAHCRNLQSYSGNLPKALLNNPIPNTCYITITPIVSATTYNMCNFYAQSATNIAHITAQSLAATTCATAPIVTITNGTVSATLTLTSGQSVWDSTTGTSTGVGTTIFKPNTTITVKYDAAAASACAVPPTNFALSYNIAPILSN